MIYLITMANACQSYQDCFDGGVSNSGHGGMCQPLRTIIPIQIPQIMEVLSAEGSFFLLFLFLGLPLFQVDGLCVDNPLHPSTVS